MIEWEGEIYFNVFVSAIKNDDFLKSFEIGKFFPGYQGIAFLCSINSNSRIKVATFRGTGNLSISLVPDDLYPNKNKEVIL